MTSRTAVPTADAPASTDRSPTTPTLVALLLLRTVLLFLVVGLGFLLAGSTGTAFASLLLYANVAIVGVDVITLAVVARLQRRRGNSLTGLIGRFRGRDLGWGVLVAVLVTVAMLVANFAANLIVYQGPPPLPQTSVTVPLWLALWSLIIMPVTVAAAEEVLYRGSAQSTLMARYGVLAGVLIPAAFFGLQHAALSATSWESMLARVITTFGVGIVFGLLRVWLKRLMPLIIGHWLFDVVGLGVPMLVLAVG